MLGNFTVSKTVGIVYGLLIVLILITIVTYFYLSKRPTADTQTATSNISAPAADKETLAEIATQSIQAQDEKTSNYEGLVDESLLKQPINNDPALIKDELHQLKDIQGQLSEQKDILSQQHQDADKLIELKEQQIADMEKQLQLQAQQK